MPTIDDEITTAEILEQAERDSNSMSFQTLASYCSNHFTNERGIVIVPVEIDEYVSAQDDKYQDAFNTLILNPDLIERYECD